MPTDAELLEVTTRQVHAWYGDGRLQPSELVDFYLRRVHSLDLDTSDGPPVNCVVRVDPTVREQAKAADAELAHAGVSKLLRGIPVWVKDNVDVRGLPTTCGCLALEEVVADADAAVIASLRRAGAIVMGKVGMTELGNGTSAYSTVSGRIGNAYDPRNPPGGSSNGSAVATSMNFGVLAVGVDDCGSIVDPASRNGCVGLRPTVGLLSREGLFTYSASDTTPGPIARTVHDAALMFDAMREEAANAVFGTDSTTRLDDASLEGIRIGVVESIGHRTFEAAAGAGSRRTKLGRCLAQLEAAGAHVIDGLRIDDFQLVRLSKIEYHNSMVAALRARSVPPRTLYELTSGGNLAPHNSGDSSRLRNRLGLARLSLKLPNVFARRYRRVVLRNRQLAESLMKEHRLDCLVSLSHWLPVMFATLARSPHLTVPVGLVHVTDENASSEVPATLPIGMSFLGRPRSERQLLEIGAAFERTVGGRRPPARETSRVGASADVDTERFHRLKRGISLASAEVLEMGPDGYLHPTHEEFRVLVERVRETELAIGNDAGGGR